MSIETDLKKDGIEIIDKLDTLSVNSLAKNIAEKICKAFPRHNFVFQDLFITISRLSMYTATMPEGIAEANYFYKNSSIYFKTGISIEELEKFAIHEIIHHLQEVKDDKGNLEKLGLCSLGDFKVHGMALNEAAVQLATSKSLKQVYEVVKYYDITFSTISPTYYPILCNLVSQMAYLIGEDLLYNSTFYSTNEFQQAFINLCGEKNFFTIQDNLDKILYTEEKIIKLNNKLFDASCTDLQAKKIAKKIENYKLSLKNTFFITQNLIFSSYFDNEFKRIITTDDIEEYRFKLYNYKNFLGVTDNYNYFNNYYIDKMAALEGKYDKIINNVYLVNVEESKISKIFRTLRKLFSLDREKELN